MRVTLTAGSNTHPWMRVTQTAGSNTNPWMRVTLQELQEVTLTHG